jgi:predicted dehydrogenase
LRVALAGLGGAAVHGHLPALRGLEAQRRLRLVAVADPATAPRRRLGPVLAGVPMFPCAETMLAAVEADVLVVATEPPAHAGLVELGFAHGVHVVCEKPLAHTEDHRAIVLAAAGRSRDLAIVSVHQYRYSSTWARLAPVIRLANALGLPFSMAAEVFRHGAEDPHAASSWRTDLTRSGGLLADHGAHFIALAWTIDSDLDVLGGERRWDGPGRERSWGRIKVGSGTLELQMSTLLDVRRTRLRMQAPGMALDWQAARADLRLARRRVASWPAAELSDRSYLDSLYLAFYRDLARNLSDAAWRATRTAESLGVAGVLVELLQRAARLDSIRA